MTHILHYSEWQDFIYHHFNDNRFSEQMSTDFMIVDHHL